MALGLTGCGGSGTTAPSGFTLGGTAVKGPLSGATAFVDLNGNGELDEGEVSATTNSSGQYAFNTDDASKLEGDIVVTTNDNTIDTSSGAILSGLTLSAPQGSSVVTPLTTLINTIASTDIATINANTALTEEEKAEAIATALSDAQNDVKAILNLAPESDVDLTSFNPFSTSDTDAAKKVETLAQQVVAVANTIAQTVEASGGDGDLALATALNTIGDNIGTIDLTDATDVASVVTAVETATSTTIDSNVDTAIAKVNEAISVVVDSSESLDDAKEVFNLAQETLVEAAITSTTDTSSATALSTIDTTDTTSVTTFTSTLVSVTGKSKTILEGDDAAASISTSGTLAIAESAVGEDGSTWIVDASSVNALGNAAGMLTFSNDGLTWTYTLSDATTLTAINELQSPAYKGADELKNADISYVEQFEVTLIKVDAEGTVLLDGNDDPITASLPKVISITINGVNDAPVMSVSEQAISVTEDTPAEFTVSATDVDSANLTYTVTTEASHGEVSNDGGSFIYTPDEDYYGTDTFVVTVSDGNGGSDIQTVTVNVANVEDEATGTLTLAGTVQEGGSLTGTLSALDVDGGIVSTTYQWEISDNGTDGWSAINAATSTTYEIASDQSQVGKYLRLVATTTDAEGGTSIIESTATVAVANVNDAPVADNTDGIIVGDSTSLTINKAFVNSLISDVDGDTLSLESVSVTAGGNGAVTDNEDGTFTYQPQAVEKDTAVTLTYTVSDGNGGTASGTLGLTVVDAIPLGTIPEDLIIDPETLEKRAPLELSVIKQTAADSLSALPTDIAVKDPDGNVMTGDYTPPQDFNGTLTFTIVYQGQELPAVLGVSSVNDIAQGSASLINQTPAQGETLSAADNITDTADGGIVARAYQWLADGVDIASATSETYALTQSDVGKAISVEITTTDGDGNEETFTSNETSKVANVNDAPTGNVVITGDAVRGGTLTADTSAIADADNSDLSFTYQWKANGIEVSGAINKTLNLGNDDVGKVFTVDVVVNDGTYAAEANQTLTSAATAPVGADNAVPVVESVETYRSYNDEEPGSELARLTISDANNDSLSLSITGVTQTFLDTDFTDSNNLSPTATERFALVNNNNGTYDIVLAQDQELRQSDYTVTVSINDGFGGVVSEDVVLDTAPAQITVGKFTIEDGVNPIEWGLGFASFNPAGAATQTDTNGSGNTITLTEADGTISGFTVTRPVDGQDSLVFSISGIDITRDDLAAILTPNIDDPYYNAAALSALFPGTSFTIGAADGISGTILGAARDTISEIMGTSGNDIFITSQFGQAGTQAIVDLETGAGSDWILVDWDTNNVVFGDLFVSDFDPTQDKLLFQMDSNASAYGHYMSALSFVEDTEGGVNYTQVFFDKNEDGDLLDTVDLYNSGTSVSEEEYGVMTFAGVTAEELKGAISIVNFDTPSPITFNVRELSVAAAQTELKKSILGDAEDTIYAVDVILDAEALPTGYEIYAANFQLSSLYDLTSLEAVVSETKFIDTSSSLASYAEGDPLNESFGAISYFQIEKEIDWVPLVDNNTETGFPGSQATIGTIFINLADDLANFTLFAEEVTLAISDGTNEFDYEVVAPVSVDIL